jgi:hypothetical protein
VLLGGMYEPPTMTILRGVWWTLMIGVRLVWNVDMRSDLNISISLKVSKWNAYVCLVPSSQVSRPGPNGNSPISTLLTVPDARLDASASSRIDDDFSPPADLTSQHRTVESRPLETKTEDSAEKDKEVMWP